MKKILITGGAGFIGSHVLRLFIEKYPNYRIFNLDKLSYAGNYENIKDFDKFSNYKFIHGDITNVEFLESIFNKYKFDSIIHLAAESHVDRSINDPTLFAKTNIMGTMNLLNCFLKLWKDEWDNKLFYHISTDEVYGSLGETGLFSEDTPYSPNSPYSASKASSDHFVRSYGETYNLPYVISNCSNNYGPNQFPEKLIPLFINNIIEKKPLPIYGDGNYTRDWLFVKDHAIAIDMIFHSNRIGETYNIGGFNEFKNIDLVKILCDQMDLLLNRNIGSSLKLIKFVKDRKGHDLRYAIDSTKIFNQLNWKPSVKFEEGIKITIEWYLNNNQWLKNINDGSYLKYFKN